MDSNTSSADSKSGHNTYVGFNDNLFEDDGFFSDVPQKGSLSKSLIALNEFVKTNLIHNEDEKTDSAFFSKECSPNGSDSISSANSNEKHIPTHIVESTTTICSDCESDSEVSALNNETFSSRNGFDERKYDDADDIQLIIQHVDTKLKDESSIYKESYETLLERNGVIADNSSDHDDDHQNEQRNKISNDNTGITKPNSLNVEASTVLSKSLNNLKVTDDGCTKIDVQSQEVAGEVRPRVKPRLRSFGGGDLEYRHTLHDFSAWVNRTTVCPEVYAPLPFKSPRRYVEGDVNIHYRCPVRRDPLPLVPERELERQQADHMRRLYRDQRRAKYLQELQDMQNRRHQDNFTPSQKAVVALNRYDEAGRVAARALYAFAGQTPRELSFAKGEVITVRRQIDANWYEGELRGRTGLFPYNYVEILKGETLPSQKRPSPAAVAAVEGRARAKFDFTAQTGLELPLRKGEVVALTRRIDHNWWEGRRGNSTGIFPDSYVTVLQEPTLNKPETQAKLTTDKPIASPASHGLLNGSAKRSMGAHSYTPQLNSPALSNAPPATQPLPGYIAKPAHATLGAPERGYGPPPSAADLNNTEPLYVDTNAEAVPYRAMYKYRPQNPDELELREGDTVYVLEKCDDGWYVGSSQRTGRLGTFPGNYVERI